MLLPGCEPGDDVDLAVATHDDFVCPLTQESPGDFDVADFLAQLHTVNLKNARGRKRLREDEELHDQIQALDRCTDVCRLQACGHSFLSVPFLYHVMTAGFKCPICRSGSENEIDLADDLPSQPAWPCLTELARVARERHRVDEAAEELTLLAQLQHAEISAINTMSVEELIEQIQITVLFNIYREGSSGPSLHMPSARVAVNLRPNILRSLTALDEHSADNTPLIYESGQSHRPLSILLRTAAQFSFTLFAQTSEGGVPFFQSPVLAARDFVHGPSPSVIPCLPAPNGSTDSLRMYWEATATDSHKILRRIEYQSTSMCIRALSLQALNGLA